MKSIKKLPQQLMHLALVVVAASFLFGCSQISYDATSLPPQFVAVPTADVSELDLSLLAAPSYSSQQIFPGDTLTMTVVTGADAGRPEEWPVRVLDDGSVEVPMVGRLNLAGQNLQSAQSLIRTASIDRGIFRSPSISLVVDDRKTSRVSVVGAVEEPGDYDLVASQADLLSALLAAGGLAEDADTVIEIRHSVPANTVVPAGGGETLNGGEFAQVSHYDAVPTAGESNKIQANSLAGGMTRIDLVAATQQARPTPIRLQDGDVVTVRKRKPDYFHVIGLVNRPDRYELDSSEGARVLDAVAMAGGLKQSLADRVIVVRQVENNPQPISIELSIREAKSDPNSNIYLADGDVVSVEETPATFAVSAVQNMVRFAVNGTTF